MMVSVLPSNGFNGPVNFTVFRTAHGERHSNFLPTSVTPAAGAPANTTLTITAGTYTPTPSPYFTSRLHHSPANELAAAGRSSPSVLLLCGRCCGNGERASNPSLPWRWISVDPAFPCFPERVWRGQKWFH